MNETENQTTCNSAETETDQDALFDTEEMEIEEMAIDGICGVY